MDAVERTEQGRVLIGDLNAELASAIARRPNSEALLADRLLQHLCGEEFFVEGGPDLQPRTRLRPGRKPDRSCALRRGRRARARRGASTGRPE